MGIHEILKWKCDKCGLEVNTPFGDEKDVRKRMPYNWSYVRVNYSGHSTRYDLCFDCGLPTLLALGIMTPEDASQVCHAAAPASSSTAPEDPPPNR